jgi:hypothetical protein
LCGGNLKCKVRRELHSSGTIRTGGAKLWEADGVGWVVEWVVGAAESGGVAGDAGPDFTERPRKQRRRDRASVTACDRGLDVMLIAGAVRYQIGYR